MPSYLSQILINLRLSSLSSFSMNDSVNLNGLTKVLIAAAIVQIVGQLKAEVFK